MQILPSHPVSMAKILDLSIKLFVASFQKLIGFFVLMAMPPLVVGVMVLIAMGIFPEEFKHFMSEQGTDPTFGIILLVLGLLMALVFSVLYFVSYPGMIYRIANVANEREDSLKEAMQVGLKKLPSMMLAVLLLSLVLMLGFVLFVIPGIILSLSTMYYPYFIVIDSLGALAALKASHNLVWGHWWRTATIFMAPVVMMMVCYVILGLMTAFLFADDSFVPSIINMFFSAFTTPYFFTLGYVQFHDLKMRQTGGDLEARLTAPKINLEK